MKHALFVSLMAAGGILGAPACQASPKDPQEAARRAILTGEACPAVGDKVFFFWMEPRAAEPGDTISLQPYWTDMPGGYNSVPAGCIGDLNVIPAEAGRFSRDETGTAFLTISPDVEAGARVRVEGTYRGRHLIGGPIEVFSAEQNPFVGVWRQEAGTCPPYSAVQELVFSGGGEMSVTWTPFEVYKDYWAAFDYDPATGAFSFEVEGGNQIPEDMVTEGRAMIEGDRLIFEDIFLGTPSQAEGGCRGDFIR
ncbi:hypothetical protein KUV46_01420 [Thalassovita mediterranea]|nr:hypothetical protein KUV46_01420 [Thalassovita mediterranea]